jgi:hypothetical protein
MGLLVFMLNLSSVLASIMMSELATQLPQRKKKNQVKLDYTDLFKTMALQQ